MLDRREALRRLGAATVATGFLAWDPEELLSGLLEQGEHNGHGTHETAPVRTRPARRTAYRFQTLDAHQRATIAELAERIIPTTETPGAKSAAIDEFADIILSEWSTDAERAEFIAGLAGIDVQARHQFGQPFIGATPPQRIQMLTALDAELTAARTARQAWRRASGAPQPPDHRRLFFHQIRSLTVSGYYSSEAGYTKERKASLIPGVYKPCMPAAEA